MEHLIRTYGLLAIFVGCLLEGESVALAGGVAAHRGLLSLPAVMSVAFAGSFATDQALFWLGRKRRDRILRSRIAQGRPFARALALIERYPNGFILAFRFIYGIRLASPLAVGVSAVSSERYLLLNLIAAALWAVAVAGAGFLLSRTVETAFGVIQSTEKLILAVILVALACFWVVHAVGSRRQR